MDPITMLRDLLRHRHAAVGVLALSALAGILVLYQFSPPLQFKSRKYTVGVAATGVLIDTPSSQVATLSPAGAGDLGGRTNLLSRLMVQGTLKARIARAAGLNPRTLYGTSMAAADVPTGPAPPRGAPVLTTQVVTSDSTQLPLIQIEAQAVDTASAIKLANAAVSELQGYIHEQAANTRIPDSRRVRVTPIGTTQAEAVARGPKAIVAVAVSIFVFGLGCACIVGLAALVRAWRVATMTERRLTDEQSPAPRTPPVSETQVRDLATAGVSSLRHVDSVAAGTAESLRPSDDGRSENESDLLQDDVEHLRVAGPPTPTKQKQRAPRQRRQSAS